MRLLIVLLLLSGFVYAKKVEIEANKFETNQKTKITTFWGNVKITSDDNKMKADRIVVYTDKKNEIEKFEADGNTTFVFHLDENTTYKGSSDKFTYEPKKRKLILSGNANVEDVSNNRKITGDKIILDEKEKKAKVVGDEKKPVRIIFELSNNKEKNVSNNKR